MSAERFDVIVLGGGLVGASLALALVRQGKQVALLESHRLDESQLLTGWDARIYAVSPKNAEFLQTLGAWPDSERIGVIRRMAVSGDQGGRLDFSAADIDQAQLALVLENRWLLAALWRQIRQSEIVCLDQARASALDTYPDYARLTLDNGQKLETRLLVGADGANSWVRKETGQAVSVKPYGQSGVVANFACERSHADCARQWFLGDSVLAWLPMPGQRVSMVWSTFDPERLLALDAEQLAQEVARAGQYQLGQFSTLTPASAYPLRLIQPEQVISERVVLVGDAAHTVHPLAGQGVNLGFEDVRVLADLLAETVDEGQWRVLRRYQRSRREAVLSMQWTCDALFKLFHQQDWPGLGKLRNAGLSLVNHLGPLKRQLARHAVGC